MIVATDSPATADYAPREVSSAEDCSCVPLPQLLQSESYTAATFAFGQPYQSRGQGVSREAWIDVFRRSIYDFQKRAAADKTVLRAEEKAEEFARAYDVELNNISSRQTNARCSPLQTAGRERVDCVALCRIREQCLRSAGFKDVFAAIKQQENEKALQLLPAILRDLDSLEEEVAYNREDENSGSQERNVMAEYSREEALWTKILRGVFAGNIFDLGATASAKLFEDGGSSFLTTRKTLEARRCAIDDFGVTVRQFCQHQYAKAVLFVDNAGSDVILGMLPLARELLRKGTMVVMAANSLPSINDITARELQEVVKAAGRHDKTILRGLSEGTLAVVESGNDLPVIQLDKVSPALAKAAQGADLMILEGMGRGIETNLDACLSCDKLNLGMIKHPEVAKLLQCEVYDCVCKFTPAHAS